MSALVSIRSKHKRYIITKYKTSKSCNSSHNDDPLDCIWLGFSPSGLHTLAKHTRLKGTHQPTHISWLSVKSALILTNCFQCNERFQWTIAWNQSSQGPRRNLGNWRRWSDFGCEWQRLVHSTIVTHQLNENTTGCEGRSNWLSQSLSS